MRKLLSFLKMKEPLPLGQVAKSKKNKIILPALHQGKERYCYHLLEKSNFYHLWVARLRNSSKSSYGGLCHLPAGGLTLLPQMDALGKGQTECGTTVARMCLIASVCLLTAENCWAKSQSPEVATLGDGGIKKANLVGVPHLCKVELEVEFLDHHGGHRLAESPCHDLFSRTVSLRRQG